MDSILRFTKNGFDRIMIADKFLDASRFGVTKITTFKLDGCKEPRPDIPKHQINRSSARSRGDKTFMHTKPCRCGSIERRVYQNDCYPCFKLSKNK